MLYKYKHNESVLTKILGLLNNIAEVEGLRKALMNEEIIESIRFDFLLLVLVFFCAILFVEFKPTGLREFQ